MMEFIVGNKITVKQPNINLVIWCRKNLTIQNPEYIKKVKRGMWLGNTPKEISLFEKAGSDLIIPFGCFEPLYKEYGKDNIFRADFSPIQRVSYNSDISLYPYQNVALQKALRAKNGIVVMPCGAGKTQTALAIVSAIGGRCLWLTHTQDLLNQSMNRAKECFSIPKEEYGTITEGKVNIGKITFATVQTMCKIDLPEYKNMFDIVIVDECHKCVGSPTRVMQFYKVLSALSARYKFGITATPKRSDGLEKSMFALLGNIIHEVTKEEVSGTTCPVEVVEVDTGYMPDLDKVLEGDGTINYTRLIDDLTTNEQRYATVFMTIKDAGARTLVLANRVKYIDKLNDDYNEYCGNSICLSSASKQERKDALRKLDSGEIDCVFATYQLAKEGLDIPSLRTVIFATPEKDETTVTQSAGRVGRKAKGKTVGRVIDLVDNFGMLKGWAKKRKAYYKKLKYLLTE